MKWRIEFRFDLGMIFFGMTNKEVHPNLHAMARQSEAWWTGPTAKAKIRKYARSLVTGDRHLQKLSDLPYLAGIAMQFLFPVSSRTSCPSIHPTIHPSTRTGRRGKIQKKRQGVSFRFVLGFDFGKIKSYHHHM